jgi:hypothetical protein
MFCDLNQDADASFTDECFEERFLTLRGEFD